MCVAERHVTDGNQPVDDIPGGAVIQRLLIPASEGRALRVAAGQNVTIVDVDGGQVGDLFAFGLNDPSEHLSAAHTRAVNLSLFPNVGQSFSSNRRRPLLTLLADTSPGLHDMLIAACDPERYRQLGVVGWHASCQENLQRALETIGIEPGLVPQPVNVFMNTPAGPDGSISLHAAKSRPGDRFTVRAEMDVVVALCACAQDLSDVNNGTPTDLMIEVSGGCYP